MFKPDYVKLLITIALVPFLIFAQEERWVYVYSGVSEWRHDCANSLVCGPDHHIYAAGKSWHYDTEDDFTVISLTNVGTERWMYVYCGPADKHDEAKSIVYGEDSNIYIAGSCYSSDTTRDFTIISLTSAGVERWIYQYNGLGNGPDYAYDISYGTDGNIYAVGSSWGADANADFTVISLTNLGTERWVYSYNGPGNYNDCGRAVIYGADGYIYAVGETHGEGTNDDFTVISLTDSGTERWVYRYNGPGNWADYANDVVYDSDSNIYVTGSSAGYIGFDIIVICLTNTGNESWIYRHPENFFDDFGYAGILGNDRNIYVAGAYGSDIPDFMVASLADSGTARWEYIYYTPVGTIERAVSVAYGTDGNVYAAGAIADSSSDVDFAVVSLTSDGSERWVYRYDSVAMGGSAFSICWGVDSNLYVAGIGIDTSTGGDFTVISLIGGPGIREIEEDWASMSSLQVSPNPFRGTTQIRVELNGDIFKKDNVNLKIYDITGSLLKSFACCASYLQNCTIRWNGSDMSGDILSAGIYFVRLETDYQVVTEKVILLR